MHLPWILLALCAAMIVKAVPRKAYRGQRVASRENEVECIDGDKMCWYCNRCFCAGGMWACSIMGCGGDADKPWILDEESGRCIQEETERSIKTLKHQRQWNEEKNGVHCIEGEEMCAECNRCRCSQGTWGCSLMSCGWGDPDKPWFLDEESGRCVQEVTEGKQNLEPQRQNSWIAEENEVQCIEGEEMCSECNKCGCSQGVWYCSFMACHGNENVPWYLDVDTGYCVQDSALA